MTPPAPAGRSVATASVAALLLGAVAIGFSPIFVRLSETGPVATAFWRVALAFPPLALFALRANHSPRGLAPDARLLALAGLMFAGDLAVWHLALGRTLVANATLESNLAVLFVTLFSWLFLKQRPTRRFLAAVVVALAGVLLLVGKNARISPESLTGDALGVSSAVFYAGYLLAVKAARDRRQGTAVIMAVTALASAAALLPLALAAGERVLPATGAGWATLLGLAFVSHVAGQGLITWSLAELPAPVASVGLLLQPATAAVAAWALLHEALTPGQLVGAVILLAGVWLARPDGNQTPTRRASM